jgi:N4-gp56 family major capsid protein
MANTSYPLNHPLAVKVWEKRINREALKDTLVGMLMGTGSDAICQTKDALKKGPGDRIRVGLRMQLSGAGVQGDDTLEGQEEALVTYHDDVFIDQLRHAVRSDGKMSEQRVPFSVREEAFDGLRDWHADRHDTAFFNQVCGNTDQTDTRYTGNQATIAASTTANNSRIIFGPLDATTENSLSASESGSADFRLTMIDKAVNMATVASPLIRMPRTPWGRRWVAVLHPHQIYDLKTDATAARVTWYDTQRARVEGGEKDNRIFNGGRVLGEYNNTIIVENTRIPLAPSTTTVRRAVFLGAQAACYAVGRDGGQNAYNWYEELFDYGNQLGVKCGQISGLKKLQFNGNDFGSIVMASHAEAP